MPTVTIIIATYNLSAALRYSIQSVLAQNVRDYELLVVGDACTDDSEEVVRSFGDSRIEWINLPQRCGSQYGPNNEGLRRARGDVIAYLGHDDLWWPGHLEIGLRALADTGADMAVAVAIINGPRESGFKGVTGLFPNDTYTPRYDFTPSSMMHTRSLVDRAGPWRAPGQAEIGVDHDFVTRCYRAGAKIVPTKEPTVFKFNTSYRRNAYRTRSFRDQAELFEKMKAGGEEFRRAELVTVIQRFLEDRFFRIEGVWDEAERASVDSGRRAEEFLRFKGASLGPAERPALDSQPVRFSLGDDYHGFEWHQPQEDPVHGHYRWSGPSTESTIALPVALDGPCDVAMHVLYTLEADALASMSVTANGRQVDTEVQPTAGATWMVRFRIDPLPAEREFDVTLRIDRTIRPFDISPSMDRRWLGVAVNWVEVRRVGSDVRSFGRSVVR
jgi:glycosyltransferase involved in cell wall biosynthesis